jgi:hypothetical protein
MVGMLFSMPVANMKSGSVGFSGFMNMAGSREGLRTAWSISLPPSSAMCG